MNTLIVRDSLDKNDIVLNDGYFEHMIDKYIEDGYENIIKECIEHIDKSKYLGNFKVLSKITNTAVSILEISTGCKTVINVMCNPDKIVNISSCGLNALDYLFSHDNLTVSLHGFIPIKKLENTLKIVDKHNETVVNTVLDYHKYWSKYYEEIKR